MSRRWMRIRCVVLLMLVGTGVFGASAPAAPGEMRVRAPINLFVARGLPYREMVGVAGGEGPFRYELAEGPKGMGMDGAGGVLSWEPAGETVLEQSVFPVQVRVRDARGEEAEVRFRLVTHDLIPLGAPLPNLRAAVVSGRRLICLDAHGLTVRPLRNILAVAAHLPMREDADPQRCGPESIDLDGERLVARWDRSLGIFHLPPSGAPVLEGNVPAEDPIGAVALRGDRAAMVEGRWLRIFRLDGRGRPHREAAFDVGSVHRIVFLDGGLVVHAERELLWAAKGPEGWHRPEEFASGVGSILTARGEVVVCVSTGGDLSAVRAPGGEKTVLLEKPGERILRRGAAWDGKVIVVAGAGRRFGIEGGDVGLRAVEDAAYRPEASLAVIGGRLLEVAGEAQLRLPAGEPDRRPVGSGAATAGDFLPGLSKKVSYGLGPDLIGWYADGHAGIVEDPLSAAPRMLIARLERALSGPVRIHVSEAGMALRAGDGRVVWCDWKDKRGLRGRLLVTQEESADRYPVLLPPAREMLLMGGHIVYLTSRGTLHLVTPGEEVVVVKNLRDQRAVQRIFADRERKLVFASEDPDTVHVYALRGDVLQRKGSIQLPGEGRSMETWCPVGQRLVGLGRDRYRVIDTTRPGALRLKRGGDIRWMLPGPEAVGLGPVMLVYNRHNAGPGLMALGMSRWDGADHPAKIARRRMGRESGGRKPAARIQAAGGLVLFEPGGGGHRPLLLASDAGFRAGREEVGPSASARSASLMVRAKMLVEEGRREEGRRTAEGACRAGVAGVAPLEFDHWNVVAGLPRAHPHVLVGGFIDDHVGVHLNSHALHRKEDEKWRIIRDAVTRRGLSSRYGEKWAATLARGREDAVVERILWHMAASSEGEICGPAYRTLVEWESPGALEDLRKFYAEAPADALPHLTSAVMAGGAEDAEELIAGRWRGLGAVTNDSDFRRYRSVAAALNSAGAKMFDDLLAPMRQTENPLARSRVAQLAGILGDPAAVPVLKRMSTGDEPASVRGWAALSLIRLEKTGDWEAIRAGLKTRQKEFAERLLEEIADHRFRGNEAAAEAARRIAGDRAWDEVHEWIRYRALCALRDIGTRKDVELLEKLEKDGNEHVAEHAPGIRRALEQRLARAERREAVRGARTVPDRPSEAEYGKKVESLADAAWKKDDPHGEHLTWFGIDGGVAVADDDAGRVRTFTNLFGFQRLEVRAIAFGPQRVWLATSRGLMAYQRESHFWSRFAPTTAALDWPVRKLEVGEGGAVGVTFEGPEGQERFVFESGREGWRRVE